MQITKYYNWNKGNILLVLIVFFSLLVHGINMFHYPYFENDEGTYFAQAWSFLTQGKMAPYTYWYDHAPGGWIFTSVWIWITRGLFTFGFSLNSARVFIWIIHGISTFLLFKITKKLTLSHFAAFITCLFFALSPLAIYFQRRLLLDNIMTFWALLSLYLIIYFGNRLLAVIGSSLTFGIAVLSKENAIFFLPFYAVLTGLYAHKHNKIFAIIMWVTIAIFVISLYPLYAFFKKELFPVGTLLSPPYDHVSLLGSLKTQASRGTGLPFWASGSDFRTNFLFWLGADPFFIILGFICLIAQGMHLLFNKASRIIFFLTISMLAFLMSGKLVINFYVIPLIPLLAMCIGTTVSQQVIALKKFYPRSIPLIQIGIVIFIFIYYITNQNVKNALLNDETTNQLNAVNWVKSHINPKKFIAIDYYGNLDLKEKRYPSDTQFASADWYWKVELDADIRKRKLHNNPKNIDYLMLTAQMYKDMQTYPVNSSLLQRALRNSVPIKFFLPAAEKNFNVKSYATSHPNGNWVIIFKQTSLEENLSLAWNTYKHTFINEDGSIKDPTSKGVTSRAVSYTLFYAVMQNDKATFDTVYQWSQQNMLVAPTHLFTSLLTPTSKDSGTSTDGDEDSAYALLLAYNKWHDTSYLIAARQMIADIWKYERTTKNATDIITAGNWATDGQVSTTNPSYFAPYIYRSFASVDPIHNWNKVITDGYSLLTTCSENNLDTTQPQFLPPNWCNVQKDGNVVPAANIDLHASNFSDDASRVLFRIGLDQYIYQSSESQTYLSQLTFLQDQWNKHHRIYQTYSHAGQPLDTHESLTNYDAHVVAFSRINKKLADQIYTQQIEPTHTTDQQNSYWGNQQSIYDQFWTWITIMMYAQKFPKSELSL